MSCKHNLLSMCLNWRSNHEPPLPPVFILHTLNDPLDDVGCCVDLPVSMDPRKRKSHHIDVCFPRYIGHTLITLHHGSKISYHVRDHTFHLIANSDTEFPCGALGRKLLGDAIHGRAVAKEVDHRVEEACTVTASLNYVATDANKVSNDAPAVVQIEALSWPYHDALADVDRSCAVLARATSRKVRFKSTDLRRCCVHFWEATVEIAQEKGLPPLDMVEPLLPIRWPSVDHSHTVFVAVVVELPF
mmetsp:Transcript_7763/g.22919  ORF Transcript_7763/g.22919 Transcript_7763/m.22919 type:complete len:245 (-) Transcript_7763:1564-2298(-)